MKRGVLYLLIALPLASVLMGMVTLYLAFSAADPVVERAVPALDKTSWRDSAPDEVAPQ